MTRAPSPPVLLALAQHVGCEALWALLPNETGYALAPGLPPLPEGPGWRELLSEPLAPGVFARQVGEVPRPVTVAVLDDQTAFLFLGELDRSRIDAVLPLLRALLQDAQQDSRARDAFLATLGHELRNPLSPMVTALHLLKLRHKKDLPAEALVIERQITNLLRLVDDLLDVSRTSRGKTELELAPVEVSAVVARAAELTPLPQLRVEVPAGLQILADTRRLAQALSHLLAHSARYSPEDAPIRLDARGENGCIEIRVSDSGARVEPEVAPRLFDLFSQGKRQLEEPVHTGLGQGLALAYNLVHLHGGTLSAHDHGPDKPGMTFLVRLPR